MPKVEEADPPGSGSMDSTGKAAGMLIRQFRFPHTYEEVERYLHIDHDRLFLSDNGHASACFRKHTGNDGIGLGTWISKASDTQIIAFLKDALKSLGTDSITWTGYRILGTVNRDSGFPVWGLELFAKRQGSRTRVYTAKDAPNVLTRPRHER